MEFLDDDMRSGQALEAVPRYKPRLIVASLNVFCELFDGSVPSRFNGVSSSLVSIVVVAPLVAVMPVVVFSKFDVCSVGASFISG